MHFLSLHPQEKSRKEDEKVEIKCLTCGRGVNLDHKVFENYFGTAKCFSCSSMMEVKIRDRVLHETRLVTVKNQLPRARQEDADSIV